MNNKNQDILKQFDVAIDETGSDSELGMFLTHWRGELENGRFKGIAIPEFTEGISKYARQNGNRVPLSVTKLMAMVNSHSALDGWGSGLWRL